MADRLSRRALAPPRGANRPAGSPFPLPRIREVRAPFSHGRLQLNWQVGLQESFPAGTVLCRLRRDLVTDRSFGAVAAHALTLGALRPGGAGAPHHFRAPEAGIVTWLAPGGWRALRSGELLAAYVPLADWEAFAARLEEQEQRLRELRRHDTAFAENHTATLTAELAAARAALQALEEETAALARELKAAQTVALPAPAEAAAPLPPGSPDELLLAPPAAAELAALARTEPRRVQQAYQLLLDRLAAASPLSAAELILLGEDAVAVIQYADALTALDNELAAALADPRLPEHERKLAHESWHDRCDEFVTAAAAAAT